MPEIYEYRHAVRRDEIDGLGHANNVAYVDWMQSAAVAHSTAHGWSGERYRRMGFGWVVRSHQIEYLQPAFAGDPVVVRTWVATLKKATSVRRYKILRETDEALLATAETKWAFVNYTTAQPMRIPREVAESFRVIDDRSSETPGTS
ncbi:MAG TPA: acyl-CoA thioesterase [Thermoguttaceae bacterium]|nr:acyl-CoA thioesterase [Thermoguttaceae bacterium]